MNRAPLPDQLKRMPVVGIIRRQPREDIEFIAEQLVAGGMTTLEITMNTPGVETIISNLKNTYSDQLLLGAGTVCSVEDLDRALGCGASYIVTPVLVPEIIEKAVALGIPIFPGAFTPTEIFRAWSLGATMVKVFPAGIGGPGYIKDVLAPLDTVLLMPSGGVTPENYTQFLQAGASAVGIGSNLFPKKMVEERDAPGLTAYYQQLVRNYQTYKSTAYG